MGEFDGPTGFYDDIFPPHRFLMDLALIQLASQALTPYIASIDLASEKATVEVAEHGQRQSYGPFPYSYDRSTLLGGLVEAAGLARPPQWRAPLQEVPITGYRSSWGALLVDLAEHGWALSEIPGLRYERYEVERDGSVLVTLIDAQRRYLNRIPIPPKVWLVGMPFEMRDWIVGGTGEQREDGSWYSIVEA